MLKHPSLGLVLSAGAHGVLQGSSHCCAGPSHSECLLHSLRPGIWDSWSTTSGCDASFLAVSVVRLGFFTLGYHPQFLLNSNPQQSLPLRLCPAISPVIRAMSPFWIQETQMNRSEPWGLHASRRQNINVSSSVTSLPHRISMRIKEIKIYKVFIRAYGK